VRGRVRKADCVGNVFQSQPLAVRSGKVALALCTLAIVGVALDSLLKVKWPIAW